MAHSEPVSIILLHVLVGTTSIAVFNILIAAAFAGFGLLIRRRFGLLRATLDDLFICFWLGFGATIAALLVWNMFFAVGPVVLPVVLAGGLAAIAACRRSIDTNEIRALPRWTKAALGIAIIWVAHIATGAMTEWDTALYHMQGVEWARLYPAVPGVANVFGPMGFNNASFLYDAMVDMGPWRGRAWHVANGVLVSALICQAIAAASAFVTSGARRASNLFVMLLLPAAINFALHGRVSSFATVVPPSLIVMVIAARLYRTLSYGARSDADRAFDWFAAIALSSVATAIKLTAIEFAVGIVILFVLVGFVRRQISVQWWQRAAVWSAAAILIVGTSWAVRGVILSGYVVFPSSILAAPVEWRVPAEHARAEYDFVVHSARNTAENVAYVSGERTGLSSWIRHWLRQSIDHLYDFPVPCLAIAFMIAASFAARRRAALDRRRATSAGWWLLVPLGLAVTVWFVTAPMVRYAAAILWSVAALFGAQAFLGLEATPVVRRRILAAAILFGLSTAIIAPAWSGLMSRRRPPILGAIRDAHLKIPARGEWFQTGELTPELTTFTTDTGLILNVPIGRFGRCWSAPLPCTPNPAPNLRLRVPGRIDRGFVVDGDWQMRDWPEPWRPELLPALRKNWERRAR